MWYSAKLLYESRVDDGASIDPLCEESIIVIDAEDEQSAMVKAVAFGHEGQHSYKNAEQRDVTWRFVGVVEIQDLCEAHLASGTEVHSRLFRKGAGREAPAPADGRGIVPRPKVPKRESPA